MPIVVRKYGEKAYTFLENMVKVTIPFDKADFITPQNGAINRVIQLSNREKQVYEAIKENSHITKEQLLQELKIPKMMI